MYQIDSGAYTGASPLIVGTRAYYGTFNNEVLAVDLAKRRVLWRYTNPGSQVSVLLVGRAQRHAHRAGRTRQVRARARRDDREGRVDVCHARAGGFLARRRRRARLHRVRRRPALRARRAEREKAVRVRCRRRRSPTSPAVAGRTRRHRHAGRPTSTSSGKLMPTRDRLSGPPQADRAISICYPDGPASPVPNSDRSSEEPSCALSAASLARPLRVLSSRRCAGQDSARVVANGGVSRAGVDREDRRQRREDGAGAEQREARARRQRHARHHRTGDDLLESEQQGDRQLHGEGDVHRADVHESEQSPAPVRHHDRGQRSGHGDAELPVLRRVRQRHVHRARLGAGGVSDGRPPGRRRTTPCTRRPDRASR